MTLLAEPTSPELQLADWAQTMSRSVLRQMIALVSQPGILSFAGGLPDPALFPTKEFAEIMPQVLSGDGRCLQYCPPYLKLKQHIVKLMAQRGVTCNEEQVFITTGAQQGLNVLARLLLNPGGQVMLEEIVYTGAQQVVAPFRPDILTVSTDLHTGIAVESVEQRLVEGERPAFIYVIPEAHNPLGVSISPEKRRRLVELARFYGVPIVEDDPYGFLTYERSLKEDSRLKPGGDSSLILNHQPIRPLRTLDEDWVFYLGSFSKILAPGLRLGWMVAPEALIPKLTVVKEAGDLESSGLMQRAVAAYLDAGHLPAHLAKLRQTYGRRRNAMLSALNRYFPADARWTSPDAGMFIWVELPETIDTAVLLETAVAQEKVAFIPGYAFAVPGHQVQNCLRLNFSNASSEEIEEGISRLGGLITNYEL